MEINYELKPEDFARYAREVAPKAKGHHTMTAFLAITYSVFIFADLIFAFIFGTIRDWTLGELLLNIGLRTIITFAAMAVIYGLIRLITLKKTKEILDAPDNGLICEHRIILDENQLIELTDVNTSRYAWKAIGEIKETPGFIAIEILMSGTYLIPKRFFSTPQQVKDFVETARTYRRDARDAFRLSHFIEYDKGLK